MGLNDHFWKWSAPGVVTGKLSDIAGCFALPLFLSSVLGLLLAGAAPRVRLWSGAAATAVFFLAIKLNQPAADAVCSALDDVGQMVGASCGLILADPTDLIALPFVFLAVAYGFHRVRPQGVTP